ncbi:MAG: hypothetical protein JST33_10975 [Actinobacteria bacterium]|nr:hypothetical protein [Actinomycetota bacterium]
MTELTSHGAGVIAAPGLPAGSRHRLLRTAGIGGIVAFGSWVLQPILVMLIVGDKWASYHSQWEYFHDFRWNGLYEGITFSGIGVGMLVLVIATSLLVEQAGAPTVGSRLLSLFGVFAGAMWILTAGVTFAPFTSVGHFVKDLVPEVADQNAVFEAMGLVTTGLLMAFEVFSLGWIVLFAVVARRRGVIGRVLAVLAAVSAAGVFSGFLMPFAPPWASLGGLGFCLIAGIGLLGKARGARRVDSGLPADGSRKSDDPAGFGREVATGSVGA